MNQRMYLMESKVYVRGSRTVSFSWQTNEPLLDHWWSPDFKASPGLNFACTMGSYDKVPDYPASFSPVHVASGPLIELLVKFLPDLEVYETSWLDAPAEFEARNYKVIRVQPKSGFLDMDQSTFGYRPPDQNARVGYSISKAMFLDGAPCIVRPLEAAAQLYACETFVKESKKRRLTGLQFKSEVSFIV